MSECLHGVWTFGKSLGDMRCRDFRRCGICGATEYKEQSAKWDDLNRRQREPLRSLESSLPSLLVRVRGAL